MFVLVTASLPDVLTGYVPLAKIYYRHVEVDHTDFMTGLFAIVIGLKLKGPDAPSPGLLCTLAGVSTDMVLCMDRAGLKVSIEADSVTPPGRYISTMGDSEFLS